ncbi:MAG TPA: type II CAAX endopeptidase family protein [Puia sp.]|nr:type II CAAX endopeptidase family protein [Puia sp.]
MDPIAEKQPLIRKGWLRVLLFCIAYLLLVSSISYFIPVMLGWMKEGSLQKALALNTKELMEGQFLGPTLFIVLIISLAVVFVFRKFIDRKSFLSLGFHSAGYLSEAAGGFFLAPALLGTGTLVLYFTKHLQWTDINFRGTDLFIEFGMMGMVAISEEVVFRGYILNNLLESFNKWVALAISALLFALYHVDNPSIDIIAIMNILLAGVLLGINYIYTKNLWFAILFHLAWNFFQGPLLGFKVSGFHLNSLLQTELSGDLLLTGGAFGFEGSVLDGASMIIAILLLYVIFRKKYSPSIQPL